MRPTHLIAALAAMTLIPTVAAVEFPFGSAVGSADYDLSPLPSTSAADLRYALCFADANGDGIASPEDYVFLATKVAVAGTCPARLDANPGSALLLNQNQPFQAGTEFRKTTHALSGAPLSPLAHALRVVEEGSDSTKFDAKDTLYLDLQNLASPTPTVNVGDLRISPIVTPSGTLAGGQFVKEGDGDLNRALANIRPASAPATKLVSTPNMVYKAGSGYYVNADFGTIMGVAGAVVTGDVGVESGDVRLNPKAANPFTDAAFIGPDHVELVQADVAPGQPFQVKVTVKNTGKATGAGLVETSIDDVVVDGRGTPSLEPNGAATLTLTLLAPVAPGRHVVRVGTYADFLEVAGEPAASSAAAAAGDLSDVEARLAALEAGRGEVVKAQGSPGAAPLAALGALVAVVLALRRRAE